MDFIFKSHPSQITQQNKTKTQEQKAAENMDI